MKSAEFAIVGAGPAGMAAAILARELGLDTLLIDEQGTPGGQIYRGVERTGDGSPLGSDDLAGGAMVRALRASDVDYRPGTTLQHLDPAGTLYLAGPDGAEAVAVRRVLIATGALERPVPIPGWTLPGVMTVGAAQILLKTADLVPTGRAVLAGQGPLLYLAAAQLVRAGAPPAAILDTTPAGNYRRALSVLRHHRPALRPIAKGLGWMLTAKRAGVPIRRGVRRPRALGDDGLERVAWLGGEIAADHLLLHEGLIPNVQIGLGLQLRHQWDAEQLCWRPVLDPWGQSSLPCIAVAGDGGGIIGADAARLSGQLAALDAAMLLGHIGEAERDRRARPIRETLTRERALRRFLDHLYRPRVSVLVPEDNGTVVCRCHEVTAGAIRRAVRLGATAPDQVAVLTGCGTGPCQGRICGPIAAMLIAASRRRPITEIGAWGPRASYKPVTIGSPADPAVATEAESDGDPAWPRPPFSKSAS